tara:strand:- start:186 stop:701 length:516 start_codon:yes stop_codon:yes gene_type:complete
LAECAFSDGLPKLPFAKKKKKLVTGDVIGWVFQVPGGYFWAGHESNGNPASSMTTCADGEDAGECYEAYKLLTDQEKAEARVRAAEDRVERMANNPSACKTLGCGNYKSGPDDALCNQYARREGSRGAGAPEEESEGELEGGSNLPLVSGILFPNQGAKLHRILLISLSNI